MDKITLPYNRNSPCMNCTNRHVGCHGTCERYITYRADLDELKDIRRKELMKQNDLDARTISVADKMKNRKWT